MILYYLHLLSHFKLMPCDPESPPDSSGSSTTIPESCSPSETSVSCSNSMNDDNSTNSTADLQEDTKRNNLIFSFAGGSIAVLGCLGIGFAAIKLYKAKFSRRRNFNYTLSEDNGNIVGDDTRVTC